MQRSVLAHFHYCYWVNSLSDCVKKLNLTLYTEPLRVNPFVERHTDVDCKAPSLNHSWSDTAQKQLHSCQPDTGVREVGKV